MEMRVEQLPNGSTLAVLAGRMDIEGAASIDMRFNALAAARAGVVVDLSEVTFMASMGLRTLMLCARNLRAAGRGMALLNPDANVEKAIRSSGVDQVMPIFFDRDAAAAAAAGAA